MKKILSLTLVLLSIVVLSGCNSDETNQNSLLSIDINPSIEFTLDKNNKVESFVFNNEDAEIAAADIDFVGLGFEEAMDKFINAAVETGFIDVETSENAVVITVGNEDKGRAAELQEAAEAKAQAHLEENKISGAVLDGAIVYEELRALAEQYEISIGKVRMIESVITRDDTKTYEDLVELPMEELMNMITSSHKETMQEFVESKKADALALKEQLVQEAKAKVESFRQKVENGEVETPDYEGIKSNYVQNFKMKIEEYRTKVNERFNGARGANN